MTSGRWQLKLNRRFANFLCGNINLNPRRLDRLRTSVGDVTNHLQQDLRGFQGVDRQGSFALGTIIRPIREHDGYDADIQVVMNPDIYGQPEDYLNALKDSLLNNHNFADKVRPGTRCVTLDYAGDFHLDVVPRITTADSHFIFNWETGLREEPDGTGYRDWFRNQSGITKHHLVRVVRLLKFLRDHQGNYEIKSILLTTIAGMSIQEEDRGTENVRTIADTLTTVLERLNEFLQQHPTVPYIANPALPSEDFIRHWREPQYGIFKDRVRAYAERAREALDSPSVEESVRLWRRLFGYGFR